MVKCRKSVPKALIKGDCLWLHQSTTFSANLLLFGHLGSLFRHREGRGNGKVQKVSPKVIIITENKGPLGRERKWYTTRKLPKTLIKGKCLWCDSDNGELPKTIPKGIDRRESVPLGR